MKKNLKELRELYAAKQKELSELTATAEKEQRDFTSDEKQKAQTFLNEIRSLKGDIDLAEGLERNEKEIAERRAKDKGNPDGLPKEIREYNPMAAIRMAAAGKLTGLELEMHQEGLNELRAAGASPQDNGVVIPLVYLRSAGQKSEKRDMTVTGGSPAGVEGGYTVATEVGPFIDYLRNAQVLTQAGARVLTGLVGNIDFPIGNTDATIAWEGEVDANAESNPTVAKKSISPKRLGTFVDVSRQLLLQSSIDVEQLVMRMLLDAVNLGWQQAAISGSGSGQPLGITGTVGVGSVVGGTNGAVPSWSKVVELESAVRVLNGAGLRMGYLTNEKVRGYWKSNPKVASTSGMIWSEMNNESPVNNYPVYTTGLVPANLTKGDASGVCSAIIFGNFDHLLMGQWGGLEVIPNPYTKSKEGIVEMTVNAFVDSIVLQPKSFAVMLDALTA